MNKDQFFTQIDSEYLSSLINNAKESIILAVLGIQCEVAQPLISAAPESSSIRPMSMDKK